MENMKRSEEQQEHQLTMNNKIGYWKCPLTVGIQNGNGKTASSCKVSTTLSDCWRPTRLRKSPNLGEVGKWVSWNWTYQQKLGGSSCSSLCFCMSWDQLDFFCDIFWVGIKIDDIASVYYAGGWPRPHMTNWQGCFSISAFIHPSFKSRDISHGVV